MGISEKLLDSNYQPQRDFTYADKNISFNTHVIKCPVSFTEDPIKYSEDFLKTKLKPAQRRVIEDLFSLDEHGKPIFTEAVFIAGMRCFALGTEVLMYDGTVRKIEDIRIGDLVMGPDSAPRTVLELSRGESELYKVKQSDAMDYVVNADHILSLKKSSLAKTSGRRRSGRFPHEPDIVNISIRDYFTKSKTWRRFYKGYTSGLIVFEEKPIPIDPYLLGVWNGDGTSCEPSIVSVDKEVQEWLQDFCNKNNARLSSLICNGAPRYRICCGTGFGKPNPIWEEFKKLNLINNKHIPQIYISNSEDIRLKVLAGMIDTDGTKSRNGYEVALSNEVLIKDLKRLVDSLGFRTYLNKTRVSYNYKNKPDGFVGFVWRLTIRGEVWRIPCLIERKKYNKNGNFPVKERKVSVLNIEKYGVGEYAGFLLDKDHLFCLADCTVVRNSGKSLIAGLIGSFLTHKLLAMDNPGIDLGQAYGQLLSAEFIATSETQSQKTAFAKCKAFIEESPWWRKYVQYLIDREAKEGKETLFVNYSKVIRFPEKKVEILSLHSNSRSLAGLTAFFVCFDEMSRFPISEGSVQGETEQSTAQAVYWTSSRAVKNLLKRNFSKMITVTSPMYEDDFGMQLLYSSGTLHVGAAKTIIESLATRYPDKVASRIGYHYNTFEASPQTPEDPDGFVEGDFDNEKKANIFTYTRDYLAIPPSAINPFFEYPEKIDKCIMEREPIVIFEDVIFEEKVGVAPRKYIAKNVYPANANKLRKYFICCDQGHSKDSFAVAMGHAEEVQYEMINAKKEKVIVPRAKIVIDFVESWVPNKEKHITVSFRNVEEVIRTLGRFFYIAKVTFDNWSSAESIERLMAEGVPTEKLGATIEMYEALKTLIYSGMVDLPNSEKLITELKQLNRIQGARPKVEHPNSGSKDEADAVTRVVWCVYCDSIRDAIHGNFMLPMKESLPTLRSIAGAYEVQRQKMLYSGDTDMPHSTIWGNGSGKGVFGKQEFFVPKDGNVKSNVGKY